MLQHSGAVVEPEQQRADFRALALLMPSETGHHAIAIALVFDLEHDAPVRLVNARSRLGNYAVETGALETPKPVRRDARVGGGGRQMNRRRRG
jgi:hypothetical protein